MYRLAVQKGPRMWRNLAVMELERLRVRVPDELKKSIDVDSLEDDAVSSDLIPFLLPTSPREEPGQTSSAEQANRPQAAAEIIASSRDAIETWAAFQERKHREEGAVIRAALEATGWYLRPAARLLGIQYGSFKGIIARHPELQDELKSRGHKPGQPRNAQK